MADRLIRLGPWRGVNNVQLPAHRVFQPVTQQDQPLAFLVEATDVDMDSEGWPRTREPFSTSRVLTSGQGGWEIFGRVFIQANGILYEGTSALVTGLFRRVSLTGHSNGLIYGSDGTQHFEIDTVGTVRSWGLPIPTLTVTSTTGSTPAGRYLVRGSWSDARGNEGGTSTVSAVTLAAAGGIRVAGTAPAGATHLNVYASTAEQKYTTFVAKVAVGSLPYTLPTLPVSVADPPPTEKMSGPWAGVAGVVSWRGVLLIWRDNVVVHSEAQEPHLFHGDSIWPMESEILAVAGLPSGIWIATATGLWWIGGDEFESMIPRKVTNNSCAAGSFVIPGWIIPQLRTSEMVSLFVSSSGLIAGLPGGTVMNLTQDIYHFNNVSRVSFAYIERGDLRQLHIALTS